MYSKVELLTDARCIVGEGPIWDNINDRLLMVDIQGKRLRNIDWQSGKIFDTVLSQQVGFTVLGKNGEIIGGAEDGIYVIEENGKFIKINKDFTLKGQRFNDGKVGPDGNLYLGTFSRDFSAAFYKMDAEGNMTELFDKVGNSNGLDWTIDGKTLYYNDTPTLKTVSFDFDSMTGSLSNKKTVFSYSNGNPDGMTIDTDGNLWSAVWGAGCVLCINPVTEKIIEKIELPVSQAACCAFAGSDLKTLIITTASHGISLKDEPLAGSVFYVNTKTQGILPNRMNLKG